jgi:hypothetical protein
MELQQLPLHGGGRCARGEQCESVGASAPTGPGDRHQQLGGQRDQGAGGARWCPQPHGPFRHLRRQLRVPRGALGGAQGRDLAQQRRCRLLIADDGEGRGGHRAGVMGPMAPSVPLG